MVKRAPPVAEVMGEAARFVGCLPVVAHNASFDCKFRRALLQRLALDANTSFASTMLLARRLCPECSSHKLGVLVEALQSPSSGRAHRAVVDAEMASHLWCRIGADVAERYRLIDVSHALLARMQATPRAMLDRLLSQPCPMVSGSRPDPQYRLLMPRRPASLMPAPCTPMNARAMVTGLRSRIA
jgi:DNA polymerase-3 subunit epsilon